VARTVWRYGDTADRWARTVPAPVPSGAPYAWASWYPPTRSSTRSPPTAAELTKHDPSAGMVKIAAGAFTPPAFAYHVRLLSARAKSRNLGLEDPMASAGASREHSSPNMARSTDSNLANRGAVVMLGAGIDSLQSRAGGKLKPWRTRASPGLPPLRRTRSSRCLRTHSFPRSAAAAPPRRAPASSALSSAPARRFWHSEASPQGSPRAPQTEHLWGARTELSATRTARIHWVCGAQVL
jgi:hypothetical protein